MAKNEVIEVKPEQGALSVRLTKAALQEMAEQRTLLVEFIGSQLVQGIDNDYAVIPGTKKRSLLQPGAQKIANIYKLGDRIAKYNEVKDYDAGYFQADYTIEIYDLRSGTVLGQCEGSCNSFEKKYKSVAMADVINTVKKMAQKRAYVGAVIKATALSDSFTQDVEEDGERPGPTRVQANIPKPVNASSNDQAGEYAFCEPCNKKMMVSKFNESELYCPGCKTKKPVKAA